MTKKIPILKDWMTASQVAGELNLSRMTVNRMIQRGDFTSVHMLDTQYVIGRAEVRTVKRQMLRAAAG